MPASCRMADHEQRKVTEIAAEYGCTPANIYALLAKLRRQAQPSAVAATPAPPAVAEVMAPVKNPVTPPAMPDLFTSGPAAVAGAKGSDRRKRPHRRAGERRPRRAATACAAGAGPLCGDTAPRAPACQEWRAWAPRSPSPAWRS